MKMKREITVAIIVGCIMIITCLWFIVGKKDNSVELGNIKVYKVNQSNGQGYYSPCSLATDDLLKIQKELNRAYAIGEAKVINNKSINGTYKITLDDKFIAFDNEKDNIVYNGTKNKIFYFESEMYDIVKKACDISDNKGEVNLEVYKLTKAQDGTEGYEKCAESYEDITDIGVELEKAYQLGDDKVVKNKELKNNYIVAFGNMIISFDNTKDKLIYNDTTAKVYSFDSSIYEKVEKVCK